MSILLYDRLEGTSEITPIVHDAVEEHVNNLAINTRFLTLKKQAEPVAIIKKHTIAFFSGGSGGPVTYTSKNKGTNHTGRNAIQEEFLHLMDAVFLALDQYKIDEASKKDALAIVWS